MTAPPLLEVQDLRVHFPLGGGFALRRRGTVKAVDGVDFRLEAGRTLGLVGESGCGKSTLGRAIVGLESPTSGSVTLGGRNLAARTPAERDADRRRMQMIFQDPFSSLNPRMTVGQTLAEPIRLHGLREGTGVGARVRELLDLVDLPEGARDRYPHEFSGGQRQRIGIARALACEPELVVCDEPVSALDVSIQAQIMRLLKRLQDELGVAYLFIGHMLGVVQQVSDEIAVMYLGQIVERGAGRTLFREARHAYTRALISAAPIPDPRLERRRRRIILKGDPPSPVDPPSGCPFAGRCPVAIPRCHAERPPLERFGPDHAVACWRAAETPELLPILSQTAPARDGTAG